MPKCGKCNNIQSRLNKGALCKACFHKKINPSVSDVYNDDSISEKLDDSIDSNFEEISNNRSIIDIIKNNMSQERKWSEEMQMVLKDQIDFLKQEIIVKNSIIENLMVELYDKDHLNNNCLNNEPNTSITSDVNGNVNTILPTNGPSTNAHTDKDSEDYEDSLISYNSKRKSKITYEDTVQPIALNNRFSALSTSNDIHDDDVCNENWEKSTFRKLKKKKFRSTTIIGDSIIKDIKQYKLKIDLPVGDKIYVKSFSGATVDDMTHYIKPSLAYKPDLFIIHGGSNDLRSEKTPNEIAEEIMNLVMNTKTPDNEIMVSGLVFRKDYLNAKGQEVNNILIDKCKTENIYFQFYICLLKCYLLLGL